MDRLDKLNAILDCLLVFFGTIFITTLIILIITIIIL